MRTGSAPDLYSIVFFILHKYGPNVVICTSVLWGGLFLRMWCSICVGDSYWMIHVYDDLLADCIALLAFFLHNSSSSSFPLILILIVIEALDVLESEQWIKARARLP
jgi:hypothetical protein